MWYLKSRPGLDELYEDAQIQQLLVDPVNGVSLKGSKSEKVECYISEFEFSPMTTKEC